MTGLDCLRAGEWIQARNAGLTPATALRLEEHLSQCPSCSAQARTLDRLQVLSDVSSEPLSPGARQRAMFSAFAQAERPPQPSAARSEWFLPSAAGALAAVAIVCLAIVLRSGELPLATATVDRIVSGTLDGEGGQLASGAVAPTDGVLATRDGAIVALAHAKIELRAHTRARWDGPARVLRLEEGSVVAEVDPAKRKSFSVQTDRFRVEVLGTRFEVTRDEVRVARGRVRVSDPHGVKLAELNAGERYRWTPSSLPSQAGAPAVEPDAPEPSSVVERAARTAKKPQRGTGSPDALLDQARSALGGREIERARGLISDALDSAAEPRQRAEALTLRAECALVAGDLRGAEAGYLEVAHRFPQLAAGENALFAAARIEVDRKRSPRGLERYLERYPTGRFVKEAKARLRELGVGSTAAQP